jgi:hypothetical protein
VTKINQGTARYKNDKNEKDRQMNHANIIICVIKNF